METLFMKTLALINPQAAAIDVGSEKLFVSIGGNAPACYGTVTGEVYRLRDDLVRQEIKTVALEATGVYWLYLWEALTEAGLEVVVVNGRHVRNVPGRKTDVSDSQWLATLHAHGLLRGGFVPPASIRKLQDYQRLRTDHIAQAAGQVQKMQQALERMNVKFHDAVTSLVGVSGLKVIRAIVAGQRNPAHLLSLCDPQIQKKKATLVMESLRGIWKSEHLFALQQALKAWEFYQGLVQDCDREMEKVLQELAGPDHSGPQPPDAPTPSLRSLAKRSDGNAPQIAQLHQLLLRICGGRDATSIPGIGDYLLLQVISEAGTDMTPWATEKHFTSWLGLSPGSRQSGKRRGHQKRHRNRAGRLFCMGARSLARSVDKGLGGFYRRLRGRKGGLIANIALARKLAVLFYRTLRHGFDYVEKGLEAYHQQYLENQRRLLVKLAAQQGFTLSPASS
jgi:transposase